MNMNTQELEEVIKIQRFHKNRMKEENIKKANDILLKMFAEASKNQVISTSRTVRINNYE